MAYVTIQGEWKSDPGDRDLEDVAGWYPIGSVHMDPCGQLSGSKVGWNANTGDPFTDLFGSGHYLGDKPECPAAGSYALGSVDQDPTCTIAGHDLMENLGKKKKGGKKGGKKGKK